MLRKQLELIAAVMQTLLDAGFSDRNALSAYATIHTFLFGRSRVGKSEVPDLADSLPDSITRTAPHLADLRGRFFYEFGIDTVIGGLEMQLVRQQSSQ